MLNPNGTNIYSAGLTDFAELVYIIVIEKIPNGKPVNSDWSKVYNILPILHSLQNSEYITEENLNALYDCLVEALNIYDTSGYPTVNQPDPVVIAQGSPGPKGDKGDDGIDGINGTNGISLVWLGQFASAPVSPNLNEAYYDTVQKKSYIWDGAVWQIIAQDGNDGNDGADGLDGADGQDGADANTILTGTVNPTTEGVNGDLYYNTVTQTLFGPKTAGVWGAGTVLKGADGIDGIDGVDGIDGNDGVTGDAGADGTNAYLYVAYADNALGSGYILVSSNDSTALLAAFDSGKDWIAMLVSDTPIGDSITASNFTNWTKYQGTGDRWTTSSVTSLTIGTGNKVLTVEQNLAYSVGQVVVIADFSDFNNRMEGYVTSYNPATGQLIVNVANSYGSGTLTAWAVSLQAFSNDPPTTYAGDSPSTVAVNTLPAGSTLTGKTYDELFEYIYAPYISPTFSAFAMSGQATTVEVGTTISGSKTFTWTTTTSGNVSANTIVIRDETNATDLATGLANDGTEAGVAITSVTKTTPASHVWRVKGTNTNAVVFQRDFTVTWQWLRFYGTSSNVTLTEAQIEALTSGLASGFAATYSLAAGNYKYFAWPDSFGSPTASTGFRDTSTNLSVAMADSTDDASYSNTENGWSYAIVSVTNANGQTTDYRLYRTKYVLGGSINIQVS